MTAPITVSRMIQAAEREVIMRRSSYQHMVHKKRMSQDHADEEIAAMQAILDLLKRLAEQGAA